MISNGLRSWFCVSSVLLSVAGWGGRSTLPAQSIVGTVVDEVNGANLPQARVLAIDTLGALIQSTDADSLGRYRIALSSSVPFRVQVDALGYERLVTPRLVIEGDRRFHLDLTLRPSPVGLEPLVISTEGIRRDAITRWLRLELGVHPASLGGKVVAGEELEALKTPGRDLVDLLRWANLPGAFVTRSPGYGGVCVMARGVSCAPIRLNGMRIDPADVASLPLDDIGAIVYLRSSDARSLFPSRGRRASTGRIEIYSKSYTPWAR